MASAHEKTLVVVAYLVMVLSNVLANKKVFGGLDNKIISDSHPTWASPDGLTFAIWGVIYTMLLVMVVAQEFASSDRTEKVFNRTCHLTGMTVRMRIVIAFLLNGVWLPVFNNQHFTLALGIMTAYLVMLASVYADMNVRNTEGMYEHVVFTTGIAMNLSWICVAFLVSCLFVCGEAGWKDANGIAGSLPVGYMAVFIVAFIGGQRAIVACDLSWAFVASWALRGIYRMQTFPDSTRFPEAALSDTFGMFATCASFAVVVSMCVGIALSIQAKRVS